MQNRTTHPEEQPAGPPPGNDPDERQAFSRRKILATLGVTAAGGALAMVSYRDDAQAATVSRTATAITEAKAAKHAWCMVIDLRVCDGCKLCTLSCRQRHQLPEEQTWIKVYSMEHEGQTFPMPVPCMMCEDPPCMYVCPVGSTFRTDEGLVLVDQDTCIGSRACMAACPYEARYFNWKEPPPVKKMPLPPTPQMPVPQQKGTVGKCVYCADRLPNGELPACVSGCPMGVIYIGDLVTDVAVNGLGETVVLSEFLHKNDAVRYKEELGTNPRCYYIAGHGQSLGAGA
jgi:molybdopterin-containing oxidoreductase family iron-sulfur binding subunit